MCTMYCYNIFLIPSTREAISQSLHLLIPLKRKLIYKCESMNESNGVIELAVLSSFHSAATAVGYRFCLQLQPITLSSLIHSLHFLKDKR